MEQQTLFSSFSTHWQPAIIKAAKGPKVQDTEPYQRAEKFPSPFFTTMQFLLTATGEPSATYIVRYDRNANLLIFTVPDRIRQCDKYFKFLIEKIELFDQNKFARLFFQSAADVPTITVGISAATGEPWAT